MTDNKPIEGIFGLIFSKTLIVAGIIFGLLFAWIGYIVFTFSFPPTTEDLTGLKVAFFLNSLGFAAISMFLIGGGISNESLDKFIRTVMVIGGVIVLIMTLVVSLSSLIAMASPYYG